MPVPDYQSLMGPLLGLLTDGAPWSVKEARPVLAKQLKLTDNDLEERIPSGSQLFASRLHWASTYMAQARLLDRPRRGYMQITERGLEVYRERGGAVDNRVLNQFREFRDFQARARPASRRQRKVAVEPGGLAAASTATPIETIESAVEEANADVSTQLLGRILDQAPIFLEKLVLQVLKRMGYGDGGGTSTQHLGRSGDEGIDGVIRQDALGLDKIYVQAKRYALERAVSRPDIQAFVGALQGQQADRGVFITTSRFTADAKDYADRVNARVVLIDGEHLARLMIRYNVGVQDEETFVLKGIDEDFFADDL